MKLKGKGNCEKDGEYEWFVDVPESNKVCFRRMEERLENVKNWDKLDDITYIIETFCPKCRKIKFVEIKLEK